MTLCEGQMKLQHQATTRLVTIMQKIFIDQIVHYMNAGTQNREPVLVYLCLTDAAGAIYRGFGPNDATVFTSLANPGGLQDHPYLEQFTGQGGDGYYGLHIVPGQGDYWNRGVYILGYQISNTTHQCAGMLRLEFR